ncbi:MAG TPA: SRPBCC family protein [Ktedonobacterales bacterium]|nr:SRPBCC family protein [Ktedonobacterales bacterium]
MAQTPTTEQTTPQRLAIEDTCMVEAPIEEVYQQWSDFSRFPEFMRNVISVTPIGDNRYHWVASYFGQRQDWDTEITSREPQRHIAWRSVTGQDSIGELSFTPQGDGTTEVRLHLELTPPTGLAPQRFDKLAQTARKNARNDMRRFSQQMSPQQKLRAQREEAPSGVLGFVTQLSVAAAAAGAGGYIGYLADKRMRESVAFRAMRSPVAPPAAIAGWVFTGASAASVLGAATYRQLGQMNNALFVGQWAPTLLATGGLVRILGHRGIQTHDTASIASWSLVGGTIGSIAASVALHTMGRRKQGLFVGQWAPTLMGAAVFTRLFNRL